MTRDELLIRLKELLPAQFEEALFRAGLPQEYLSAGTAPQATRAIEAIRYLEAQHRLPQLVRALEEGHASHHATTHAAKHALLPRLALVVGAAGGTAVLGLLAVMLWSAPALIRVGLTGHVWYVFLLLLGLFAAITVFTLFKSYARYRGQALGGTLKLGGPVVVTLVVIVLSFYLVPAPLPRFDVTVFFHGKAGRHAMVLRNHGRASLDLGVDRRIEAIGDKGEARVPGIPGDLRDRDVALGLDDDTYELVDSPRTIRLGTEAIYAAIEPRRLALVGYIHDERGRPVPQARAVVAAVAAVTDKDGRFELMLPADLPEGDRTITITAAGYESWSGRVVLGGDPLRVPLSPSSDGR